MQVNVADLLIALLTDNALCIDSGDALKMQNNLLLTHTVVTPTEQLNVPENIVS